MLLICFSASATDCCGESSPRAALAYMLGMTKVYNTSPMAGLAGPGWPMLVHQSRESLSTASLSGGLAPNGSLSSQPSRSGTASGNAGKS